MQVKSKDGTITAIRGRIGNFIFRTRNNKISVFYMPKKGRPNLDPISDQLREITTSLNLEIVE